MIHCTRFLLPGAALLAVLALPAGLSAQDSATTGTRTTTATTAVRPAPQDEGASLDPAERTKTQRDALAKLRAAEIQHRERLATIHRLRALAESQGQAEKLALLDKLEVKEGARYNSASQYFANQLGDTSAYKQSLLRLSKGRLRSDELAQPKPAKPQLTPEERKARNEARAAKKAAEKAAQPATTKPDNPRHKKADAASAKLRHKKDAGSTPGADPAQPAKPAEPGKEPAPGEEPKPGEPAPAPPADGSTPRSGS